ncbi:MAG: ABC transporter permease subunit [Coprobacillus sp.]|nr:ABC transporter permease subunit [Coprobacillus sp.]
MKSIADKPLYKWILIISGIVFVFLLWWILAISLDTTLFPGPWETFEYLFQMMGEADIWIALGSTLLRLLICFVVCFILALIVGTIAGLFKPFYTFLSPLITILRTLPTAAVIYALIVLTQVEFAIDIICFLLIFPILYEAVANGIQNIDPQIWASLRLDGKVYRPRSIFCVLLPLSKDYISLGIIQSLGLGMKVLIMAEILCGSSKVRGLGRLIYYGALYSNMKEVFAVAIVAIIVIGVFDIILHYIKKPIKARIA